jgi:Na+/melibiose symporter-like transporter
MSTPTQTHNREPSITALVTGIVNDGQELLRQQLALFKSEIRQEMTRARQAAVSLTTGLVIAVIGGVLLLGFMLPLLISWGFDLPVWVGFGIVGGALLFVGLIVCAIGRYKLETVHPLPEQTMQSIKENVQWLKQTPR